MKPQSSLPSTSLKAWSMRHFHGIDDGAGGIVDDEGPRVEKRPRTQSFSPVTFALHSHRRHRCRE
jgi:hypothetical protein